MRELALFAGAGGGILGGRILGWHTVCAVELDDYARRVLFARQRDGCLDRFPIWDDIRTFDGRPWRGRVDIVTGGFPCQDISAAGRGAGLAGTKSGLWREMARIIDEVRPAHCFIENSPMLRTRGLVTVLKDLARMRFDASWGVLGADALGAPHKRKRMWIAANANDAREREQPQHAQVAGASTAGRGARSALDSPTQTGRAHLGDLAESTHANGVGDDGQQSIGLSGLSGTLGARQAEWWPVAVIPRVDDGVAHRVDRARATGNGQVSGVAALAWEALKLTGFCVDPQSEI